MGRFYVQSDQVRGNHIVITGDEAHHIRDVMRLKCLDKITAFDGTGKEYICIITSIDARSVTVEIVDTRLIPNVEKLRITLIQAIPKKEKMDYIVEKATELGANRILPVVTARTIVDWDQKKRTSAVARWQKIALETSKQCGRIDIPEVGAIGSFDDAASLAGDHDIAMIAALSDSAVPIKNALKVIEPSSAVIAIGPEGDFTQDEIDKAVEAGFKLIDLGPRVLKSDTAGLAVLSILNYEFRD